MFGIRTRITSVAATAGVDFKISLDKHEAAEGGTVEATIIVDNNSGETITSVQVIYDNDGSTVFSGVSIDSGKQYGTQKSYTANFPSGSDTMVMSFTVAYLDDNNVPQTDVVSTQVTESSVVKVTGSASADASSVDAGDSSSLRLHLKTKATLKSKNAALKAPPIDGGSQIGTCLFFKPGRYENHDIPVPR